MTGFFERSTRFLHAPMGVGPRLLLTLAAPLVLVVNLLPLWNLTMFAPQYPNGLRLDIYSHTLAPGRATGAADDPPMHEAGSRETALVESGGLLLVCDGQRYPLQEGDCVTFDADLPHHFENPGDVEAVFLAVVSAGLRRS